MEKIRSTPCARGVTLIETVVYLGLFAIVIGGLMVSAFYIADSGAKTKRAIAITEEGTFINRKLAWASAGATDARVEDGALIFTRIDIPEEETPLTFSFDGTSGMLTLTRGSREALPLVPKEYAVTDVVFSVVKESAHAPVYVRVSYTIHDVPFRFDTYLRK